MRIGLFLLVLARFSQSLASSSLTMMSLGVVLFEFILHEVCWPSLMCRLMFFIKLGKLLTIISLDIPSVPLFLSYSRNSHNAYVHTDGASWVGLWGSVNFVHFLFIYFLFFPSCFSFSDRIILIDCKLADSSKSSYLLLNPSSEAFVSVLYFSSLKFLLGF